jgi:transcriptional regulator with XRE-family HTH domain
MPLTHGPTPDSLLQHLGHRLRHLRKARNLRQLDMATLGLNYKYYQRLELGQVNPTLLTLYKVAAALEVSVYELFRLESDHTPTPPHHRSEEQIYNKRP